LQINFIKKKIVSAVCYLVVSATGRSLAQRSPTESAVPECKREASITRKPRPTRDVEQKKMKTYGGRGDMPPLLLLTLLRNCLAWPRDQYSLLLDGHQGYFVEVKQPGLEAHHSSPPGADIQNTWNCFSVSSPVCLHDVYCDVCTVTYVL
jgi:hypothetical protein